MFRLSLPATKRLLHLPKPSVHRLGRVSTCDSHLIGALSKVLPYPLYLSTRSRLSYSATSVRKEIPHQFSMADLANGQMPRTRLIFQLPEHQETSENETKLVATSSFSSLTESDQALLKVSDGEDTSEIQALIFESTVFHAQGGGQPSDVGFISSQSGDKIFDVVMVRQSVAHSGVVLHFGKPTSATQSLQAGDIYVQHIDLEKRLLFSKYHTAGHALGAATRALLESKIEGFDELKASHFPDSASCEFKGSIDGKWKGDIQTAVDKLIDTDAEVKIEWWTKADFKAKNLARLLPSDEVWKEIGEYVDINGRAISSEGKAEEDTRIRVVNIVGAEVYPCGGTHVASIKKCGKVGVKKISRSKGTSRVSYNVS